MIAELDALIVAAEKASCVAAYDEHGSQVETWDAAVVIALAQVAQAMDKTWHESADCYCDQCTALRALASALGDKP